MTMGKNIKNKTRKRVRYGASTYETHLWCYEKRSELRSPVIGRTSGATLARARAPTGAQENYSQEVIICT